MGLGALLSVVVLSSAPAAVELYEVPEEEEGLTRYQHPFLRAGRLSEHIVLSVIRKGTALPELSLRIRTTGDEPIGLKSAIASADGERWRLNPPVRAESALDEASGEHAEWFVATVAPSIRGILEKMAAAETAALRFEGKTKGVGREWTLTDDDKRALREVLAAYDKLVVKAERELEKLRREQAKIDERKAELDRAITVLQCQRDLADPRETREAWSSCGGYLKGARLRLQKTEP